MHDDHAYIYLSSVKFVTIVFLRKNYIRVLSGD